MIYSIELKVFVDSKFDNILNLCGEKKKDILNKLSLCNEEEKLLIKYLYCSMPVSDMANYDFELYLQFVKHALFLQKEMPWGLSIPEDIFLNYVLHYRVNNEDIEDNRKIFYDLIHSRINGKSMQDAVIEVNYWCLENATYKSTDARTASPLTVLKRGYGRCGEESTFTVSALRSVGIPARQIYTPRWAHCDDNHAWVEVWCDGKWHYLGACEPDPVLDKGWFTSASSRAMVIHSKLFSDYYKDEDIISKRGMVNIVNNIKKYADYKLLNIEVVNSENHPVSSAEVYIEIVNYSELAPLAKLITDINGKAKINIGMGSIRIHAVKDGRFAERLVNTNIEDTVTINIDNPDISVTCVNERSFGMLAPVERKYASYNIDGEVEKKHDERVSCCNEIRISKKYHVSQAGISEEAEEILVEARGNYEEIVSFLNNSSNEDREIRLKLLLSLNVKDYADIKCEILEEHMKNKPDFNDRYSNDLYYSYVLCPRICYEKITAFRSFILHYFDFGTKSKFINDPSKVWDFVNENIEESEEYEYDELSTNPVALLKFKKGNLKSKKILFVAICRTLGIPARINKINFSLEYFKDGFVSVEETENNTNSILKLYNEHSGELKYFQHWSLAVLDNGLYQSLNLDINLSGKEYRDISLKAGSYRIITSNRLPNGNNFANEYAFDIAKGETKKVCINLRPVDIKEMLVNNEVMDFYIHDKDNDKVSISELIKDKQGLFIWAEVGKEPTEHIFNEFIERCEDINNIDSGLFIILKDKADLNDALLKKVINKIPSIKIYYDDFTENANTIARKMYIEPGKFPLSVLIQENLMGIYASSGYNVGTADLIIRIYKAIEKNT